MGKPSLPVFYPLYLSLSIDYVFLYFVTLLSCMIVGLSPTSTFCFQFSGGGGCPTSAAFVMRSPLKFRFIHVICWFLTERTVGLIRSTSIPAFFLLMQLSRMHP